MRTMDQGTGAALAYTVDSQGRALCVREATTTAPGPAAMHSGVAAPPPVALRTLVAPLTWEPVQRLLAWGAREGLTAAELLDSCRAATRPTTRRQRSAR